MCKHLRMEPEGDPEARIRDLERPLADQAQASELGTRPYEAIPSADVPVPHHPYSPQPDAYPQYGAPQYGSPQYGSPYYAPPQHVVHKRPQTMLWLIPLVVIGIIGFGAVGLVAFVNLAGPGTDSPPRPPSPGISGGGPVDVPDVDINIPEIEVPFDPGGEVVTVGAGDTLSFGGIDQTKTVVCNQGTVNISGMTNTIDIQGNCAGVSVSGMDNVITVESAQSITASGFDNQVTYRAGTPEISTSGTGNTVEQG